MGFGVTNDSKGHQTVAVDVEGEPKEVKRNGKGEDGNTCEIMRCVLLYINIFIRHAMTCNYFSSQLFNG